MIKYILSVGGNHMNNIVKWEKTIKFMRKAIFRGYIEDNAHTTEQKILNKIVISGTCVLIFVPMLIFPFMISFEWPALLQRILVGIWVIVPSCAYIYATIRRIKLTKMLLSVPIGEEKVELVHLQTLEELDFIYNTNGNVFQIQHKPDSEFCNILYNWYRNMGILKDDTLIMYIIDATLFDEKFQTLKIDAKAFKTVVGVFARDMELESMAEFIDKTAYGIGLVTLQKEHPEYGGTEWNV